jgi:hypothetical protein
MSKKLQILEKALEDMKRHHHSAWMTYGSELCAGDMSSKEKDLEKKIRKLKEEEESRFIEDASQIIDN